MKAIKLLQEYMDNYKETQKHKTSPAMIKFNLKDHVAAIEEIEQLQADLEAANKRIEELERAACERATRRY